jgi:hypothetical protein
VLVLATPTMRPPPNVEFVVPVLPEDPKILSEEEEEVVEPVEEVAPVVVVLLVPLAEELSEPMELVERPVLEVPFIPEDVPVNPVVLVVAMAWPKRPIVGTFASPK